MEIYNKLPSDIQRIIFLYCSHPEADLIKKAKEWIPRSYVSRGQDPDD